MPIHSMRKALRLVLPKTPRAVRAMTGTVRASGRASARSASVALVAVHDRHLHVHEQPRRNAPEATRRTAPAPRGRPVRRFHARAAHLQKLAGDFQIERRVLHHEQAASRQAARARRGRRDGRERGIGWGAGWSPARKRSTRPRRWRRGRRTGFGRHVRRGVGCFGRFGRRNAGGFGHGARRRDPGRGRAACRGVGGFGRTGAEGQHCGEDGTPPHLAFPPQWRHPSARPAAS